MASYTDENGQTWFRYTVECAYCPNDAIATIGYEGEFKKPIVVCESCLEEYIQEKLKEVFGMCEFCFRAAVAMTDSHTKVCDECGDIINHLFKFVCNKSKTLLEKREAIFCVNCGYPACFDNTGKIASDCQGYSLCEGCFSGEKQPLTQFEEIYFEHLTGVKHHE